MLIIRAAKGGLILAQYFLNLVPDLGNLNENPREGFAIVSACTDTWRETMTSQYNSQEERLLKLEHSLLAMNTAIQGSHSIFLGLQAECKRIDAVITQHETLLPRLRHEVETSSQYGAVISRGENERVQDLDK